MEKLIVIVCLLFSINCWSQDVQMESKWKSRMRDFVATNISIGLSTRLFGVAPTPEPTIQMPDIPMNFKKSTNVDNYSKVQKGPTSFDALPNERKRQFDFMFVKELFQATRKVEAKDEDLSSWMNVLDQGGSREGIYQALVLDEVYAALENIDENPSSKLLDFCLNFSSKYLAQDFKTSSLEQLNLYSLKRIFTEKGIDLMEYWESKDLDALYRWYALVSADFAVTHGSWLRSELRQNTSADTHYEWAKSMPIQHVKSEFIIKLHTIMNGIQLIK